jgi:hypothetical protein
MINHKKGERNAREKGHQPEEVTVELRNKSVCPTRKFWGKRQGYKYPTSNGTQGIQERERDLLRCHLCDHFFSDKWDPPDSPTQAAATA